jgi:hypothetical protein
MQQVNLYLPELRPRRDWPKWRDAVLVAAAFLALMLIVQVIWTLRANAIGDQIDEREAALARMQARLDQLEPSVAVVNQSFDLGIAQLEIAIANREKVRRVISGQNVGNSKGFHANMLTLARESRRDIALDHFSFSRGGGFVEMHGSTRDAEAVPLYLQRLKAAPAFDLARFGLLSVSSQSASSKRSEAEALEFSLGYDNVYKATGGEN